MKVGIAVLTDVTLSTSAVTMIQLVTASNKPIKILGVEVTFGGTSSTATPIKCRLRNQTAGSQSATSMAVGEINLINQRESGLSLDTTGNKTFTVEPDQGTVLAAFMIHPQGGTFWRPVVPIEITDSSKVGLVCQAGAAVAADLCILFEE